MKVQLELHEFGGISCLSDDCPFQKACANHESAGDYRSEDDFTPKLILNHGEYFCNTYDCKPSDEDYMNTSPENYDKLGCGSLSQKDLGTESLKENWNQQTKDAFNAIQGCFSGDVYKFRNPKEYVDLVGKDYVGDLICNLMHYCNSLNIDFEEQIQYAKRHYHFEDLEPEQ